MASLNDVESAVANLLTALFPDRQPVRGWYGEAAVPGGPYFYYRSEITDFPDIPDDDISDDGLTQTVSSLSTVTVSISFNGSVGTDLTRTAMSDAVKFRLSLHQSQRTVDLYRVAGLLGVTSPQDLTSLEIGTMRSRADMRLSLSVSLTLENTAEYGESVGLRIIEKSLGFDRTIIITDGEPPNV